MAKTVVGLFDNFSEAQQVVQDLVNAGFSRNDISLAANENGTGTGTGTSGTTGGSDAGHGAAKGAGTGAALGGVTGLLVGLGALTIPGIGPILAAGPLAAALGTAVGSTVVGAGIGAAAGGLIGGLTHLGVPREEAEYYSEGVRRGGSLVTVSAPNDMAQQAVDIMNGHHAVDIDRRGADYKTTGYTGYSPDAQPYATHEIAQERDRYAASANSGETVIPIVEEELAVGKRQVQSGGARIHTHITETPVEESISLHEEHVTIDRRPVNRAVTSADQTAFREGTIEVTETSEVPVVAKQARVVEEVVVGKTATDRTETVRDTVRRTDVDVQDLETNRSSDVNNLDEDETLDTTRTNTGSRSSF